jgi:hypothetical protein
MNPILRMDLQSIIALSPLFTLAAMVILHRFRSVPDPSELESKLEENIGGEKIGPSTSEKRNDFEFEVIGGSFEVYERQGIFYKYIARPILGFQGETQIAVNITGDVFVEEGVLIKQIASRGEFRQVVGDLKMESNHLTLALNTASVGEVRETLTGLSELADIQSKESLPEETIRVSDHKVLGLKAADGVSRPILLDIRLPNRPPWRVLSIIPKRYIKNTIGRMNRTYVWIRQRPRKRTSQAEIRFRDPSGEPDVYQLGVFEIFSVYNPFSTTSAGSQRLLDALYMGYGVKRDFIESSNDYSTVTKRDIHHFRITLARDENLAESYRGPIKPSELGHIQKETIGWKEEVVDRKEIEVPIEGTVLKTFKKLLPEVADGLDCEIISDSDDIWAEAISAENGSCIRCYYRIGNGAWYVGIEWLPDGSIHLVESGEVDRQQPIPTQGHVLWHRLHPGRDRAYHTDEHDGEVGYYVSRA